MFKNFDWKHWTLLLIGLVVTAGPDVAAQLGNDGFTGAAGRFSRVVAFLTVIMAMLKRSPLASAPDRPKPVDWGSRGFVGVHVMFAIAVTSTAALFLAAQTGCTKAQGLKLESGLPLDAQLVACVLETALTTGLDVAAVAGKCGGEAIQVAEILYEVATLPKGEAATHEMIASAFSVRSTPAFRDAYYHYPQAAR